MIKIVDLTDKNLYKSFDDLKEIKGITLYCSPSHFIYEDKTAFTEDILQIIKHYKMQDKAGYSYVCSSKVHANTVPKNKIAKSLSNGKNTYINKALYNNKANENCLSLYITIPKDEKYEDIENKSIELLAHLLVENNLTADNVFRAFDLNRTASPLHLIDKDKWRAYIHNLKKVYVKVKDKTYTEEYLKTLTPTMDDEYVRNLYLDNKDKVDEYASKFEPDSRDIKAITDYKSEDVGDILKFDTANNTTFNYTVEEKPPNGSEHCTRAYDSLQAKATPNTLEVEPIYPDIVVPPGGTITIVENLKESEVITDSSTSLNIEDFKKRQKTFNMKDYKNVKKEINGRPVNNNDPFPVDDKIKELESHMPKVKVDEVTFKLKDCNHPGSVIGKDVSKNFALIQDEIITIAKRTERRLVKIENILSTVTRNLFRASSRMNVNCVYYGGQDIYGKYKCIRCTHDDRVNDGQSMTLDQCLSCTRYEPIIGQIYAILDETGTNLSQVLDDAQMSFMNLEDYVEFTRTEEVHTERKRANFKQEIDKSPKDFKSIWDEGFKMNWNSVPLETQMPNINEYKIENIEATKPDKPESSNQGKVENEFEDSRSDNTSYEELKFNIDDYNFEGFGDLKEDTSTGDLGGGFGTANEIRNKIVEFAKHLLDRNNKGTACYSQSPRNVEINGMLYHDCSSLTQACYNHAGLSFDGYTGTQYPLCYSSAGGILMPISELSKAIPGDVIFFSTYGTTPSQVGFPDNPDKLPLSVAQDGYGGIGHVAVYIGDGKIIEAITDEVPLTQQYREKDMNNPSVTYPNAYCIGRPKCLVDADKASEVSAVSSDAFNADKQKLPADLRDPVIPRAQGWANSVIQESNKWGYHKIFVNVCKEKSKHYGITIDPYMMLALAGVESNGNVYAPPTPHAGIFQIDQGAGGAVMPSSYQPNSQQANDFLAGQCGYAIDMLMSKRKAILSMGQEFDQWHYHIHGYNIGEGSVINTVSMFNLRGQTAGEFAPNVKQYIATNLPSWGPTIRYEYFAKVLWTYNFLVKAKLLG